MKNRRAMLQKQRVKVLRAQDQLNTARRELEAHRRSLKQEHSRQQQLEQGLRQAERVALAGRAVQVTKAAPLPLHPSPGCFDVPILRHHLISGQTVVSAPHSGLGAGCGASFSQRHRRAVPSTLKCPRSAGLRPRKQIKCYLLH